tara:strand:- start:7450 stop:8823 length:1374 start_codon:yes stop_codon:yes gene_type:complete
MNNFSPQQQQYPAWMVPLKQMESTEEQAVTAQPAASQYPEWMTPLTKQSEEPKAEPSEESYLDLAKRTVGRTAARVGETAIGIPAAIRDTAQMGTEFVADQVRKLFGKEPLTAEQKQQARERASSGGSPASRAVSALPSSQDVRQGVTQKLTGGYLEPQGAGEEFIDEVAQDITALSVGGPGSFLRKLGTSVAANAGKETAKALNVGEGGQAATKIGVLMLGGWAGQRSPKEMTAELYNDAYKAIPKDAKYNASTLATDLKEFRKDIMVGGATPAKNPTIISMKQLDNKIRAGNGQIDVVELPGFRNAVNEIRFGTDRLSAAAQNWLNKYDSILNKHLDIYGSTNPAFLKNYRDANLGFSGLKQSNKIANFISRKVPVGDIDARTATILMHASPGAMKSAGIAIPVALSYQMLHRMTMNPVLRKHYLEVVKAASKENAVATARAVQEFDKAVKGEEN